jgi:hypothetical protein
MPISTIPRLRMRSSTALVHNPYQLDLSGDSLRKLKSLRDKAEKPVGAAALADQS